MNTNDIWLIAGLGNPETKYDGTRHNAGYAALDYLADKWGISVSKTKFEGLWGQGEVDGHKVVLLKPLTYIGDSDVGKYCNFGCGTVTCNYDGKDKFRTTIGDYCFIGCNTNLVAPVKVGDGAYTAAGSTITQDVPAQALGIARERQTNLEGWAEPKMEAYIAKKQKLEADQNK